MGRNHYKAVLAIILLFFLLLFYNFQSFSNKQIYNVKETTELFRLVLKFCFKQT